ncbi:MAG TPA: ribonuclease E inhibitor RraB [Tabrizicola sp.]|nr:ribonuclease E inhibitor RraB [Tabrizicola sp.]
MWTEIKRILKSASITLLTGGSAALGQTPSYPDNWATYLGERSGYPALILYNVGIGEVLGTLPQHELVSMVVKLKVKTVTGLPAPVERDDLFRLDDDLTPILTTFAAHDLGRVSTQGERRFYVLTGDNAPGLGEALRRAAEAAGYVPVVTQELNGAADIYASVLVPSPDEKRVLDDQMVLRQLAESGDVAEKSRRVDHWAYFPSREAAESFAAVVATNGFEEISIEEQSGQTLPFLVKSSHTGTMVPEDILQRTQFQDRTARDAGGQYDGWETFVMR